MLLLGNHALLQPVVMCELILNSIYYRRCALKLSKDLVRRHVDYFFKILEKGQRATKNHIERNVHTSLSVSYSVHCKTFVCFFNFGCDTKTLI